jgi:hypothetical protein
MSPYSDLNPILLQVGSSDGRSFFPSLAPDWEIYLLLVMVGVVAIIRMLDPAHLSNLWIAFTSFKLANQMFRTEQRYTWSTLALMTNAVVVLAVATASAVEQWIVSDTISYGNLVLMLTGCLSVGFLLRFTVPVSIAGQFKARQEQELYDAHWLLALQCFGLFMLPLVIAGKTLPGLSWLMIALAVVTAGFTILFALVRGVLLSAAHWHQRPAHFFLYFCALYIAALAVAARAFANYVLEK